VALSYIFGLGVFAALPARSTAVQQDVQNRVKAGCIDFSTMYVLQSLQVQTVRAIWEELRFCPIVIDRVDYLANWSVQCSGMF
jgi:hypothetical protein